MSRETDFPHPATLLVPLALCGFNSRFFNVLQQVGDADNLASQDKSVQIVQELILWKTFLI